MSLSKTGISYGDFGWNPCGCSCTKGCDGCWVHDKVARRQKCPLCRQMAIHFHPERLGDPAKRKKPATILVQFTGELFDPERSTAEIDRVLGAIEGAPRHDYVFLTQQPERMRGWGKWWAMPHVFPGVTVHNRGEYWDRVAAYVPLWKTWISAEPLRGPLAMPDMDVISGVIVGCDNRPNTPFDLRWYESIVEQCAEAGVPCFVKQIQINGKCVTDPARFPEHLRVRQLPWRLRT